MREWAYFVSLHQLRQPLSKLGFIQPQEFVLDVGSRDNALLDQALYYAQSDALSR